MTTEQEIKIFCANLQYLRKINDLSLREMAKQIHISLPELLLIEHGRLSDHTSADLVIFASLRFHIRADALFAPLYTCKTTGDPL